MSSNRLPDGCRPKRPEALPKAERVRKNDEFTRILRNGERVHGRFVSACWVREPGAVEGTPNRIGIAVGRKLGGAAVRNRLKRRLREAYRRNKRELPCRGISMVFLASPRTIGRSWDELQDEMRVLLRRLGASSD